MFCVSIAMIPNFWICLSTNIELSGYFLCDISTELYISNTIFPLQNSKAGKTLLRFNIYILLYRISPFQTPKAEKICHISTFTFLCDQCLCFNEYVADVPVVIYYAEQKWKKVMKIWTVCTPQVSMLVWFSIASSFCTTFTSIRLVCQWPPI